MLLELAERAEKAEGPDRELDAEICCAAGSLVDANYVSHARPSENRVGMVVRYFNDGHHGTCIAPDYTFSLDAALTLVPEGWGYIDFRRFDDGTVGCDMEVIGVKVNTIEASAATPALALTAAALRARHAAESGA